MSSKYDRQIDLINYLARGNREKCSNLAFRFGVSTKTIKKDISDLSLFYPIDTYQGHGGGVEMRRGYIINGYIMKRRYLDIITEALMMMKKINPDPDIIILLEYTAHRR